MLLGVLRDADATASDLYLAGTLTCRIPRIDDRWVYELLSVVQRGDLPEATRAKAAIPLGPLLATAEAEGFDDCSYPPVAENVFRRAQTVLHDLYANPAEPKLLRLHALEAFAHAPEERLENAIRAAYAGDDDWRAAAVRCMFFHDGFEPEIIESLSSGNLAIRSAALRAAGPCELEEAWPHIRAVLKNPSGAPKPLLLAAIDSIGHIRPEEAQHLLQDLVSSSDEDIARAAKQSLAFVLWPLAHWQVEDEGPCRGGNA
jgi:HEAT repeat protein